MKALAFLVALVFAATLTGFGPAASAQDHGTCQMSINEDQSQGSFSSFCHSPQGCPIPGGGQPPCNKKFLFEDGLIIWFCDCFSDNQGQEPECCHIVEVYDPATQTSDWDVRGSCRPAIVDCPDGGFCTYSGQEVGGELVVYNFACSELEPGQ